MMKSFWFQSPEISSKVSTYNSKKQILIIRTLIDVVAHRIVVIIIRFVT